MLFKKKEKKSPLKHLLLDYSTGTRYAEAYRTLRTNLYFSAMDKALTSVLITSSVPSEGKSNTAFNLAFTMAQTGSRVLLVDGDLRRPKLTGHFGLKNHTGVSELIADTLGGRLIQGDLDGYSIGDILQLLKIQKRTGEVLIQGKENQVSFFFNKGFLRDIFWENRPEGMTLADTLVKNNLLTRQEVDLALGNRKKSGLRLGQVLSSLGMVAEKDLSRILALNIIESIQAASTITQGTFVFTDTPWEEMKNDVPQKIDLDQLMDEYLGPAKELKHITTAVNDAVLPMETENLFILPAGKVPPNPSELLGSDRVPILMEALKQQFDFIVLDTPPVMPASDAMLLAPLVDGILLVVRSGTTEKKILKDVLERFRTANLKISGFLLNRVDMKNEGYYRYYKKYYASYYGKEE